MSEKTEEPTAEEQAKETSVLIETRKNKARAYREAGKNPFVNRFDPKHKTAEIHAASEELVDTPTVVSVAGRVLTIRSFGKANFFHLQDGSGRIQAYVRKGEVPDEDFELLKKTLGTSYRISIGFLVEQALEQNRKTVNFRCTPHYCTLALIKRTGTWGTSSASSTSL